VVERGYVEVVVGETGFGDGLCLSVLEAVFGEAWLGDGLCMSVLVSCGKLCRLSVHYIFYTA
jgi:hypothetical protein